jgi:Spy/CpxP family protein refolding chaperone
MSYFRSTLGILSVLVLIAAIAPAAAQRVHMEHGDGHGHGMHSGHGTLDLDQILDHLDVDDDQRARLRAGHDQYSRTTDRVGGDADAAHEVLAGAIHSETFDEGAIRAAAAEYSRLQADLFVAKAEMFHEVRQILSPDQLDRLKEVHGHGGRGENSGRGLAGHPLHHN